jgi:hypothetical protein
MRRPRAATSLKSLTVVFLVIGIIAAGVALWGFFVLNSTPGGGDTVVFGETGLAPGVLWGVTLNGVTETSTVQGASDSISFSVNGGTYNFTVLPVQNYTASPPSGIVTTLYLQSWVNITFTSSLLPIGSAFAVGNPVAGNCATGYTFVSNGCNGGDYTYSITIEASSADFGDVLFSVRTAAGGQYPILTGSGGFSVIGVIGNVEAQSNSTQMGNQLSMATGWLVYGPGIAATYPLTSIDVILIDMGPSNPTGLGLTFTVFGTESYSGSTSPLPLP